MSHLDAACLTQYGSLKPWLVAFGKKRHRALVLGLWWGVEYSMHLGGGKRERAAGCMCGAVLLP
jgi:hypothetical protein